MQVKGAVFMPLAASINPKKLMRTLLAEVSAYGNQGDHPGGSKRVRLLWGCSVTSIQAPVCGGGKGGGSGCCLVTIRPSGASRIWRSMQVRTRATVLAVGPHSQLLAKSLLSLHVPIVPVLGTMFRLERAAGRGVTAAVSGGGSGGNSQQQRAAGGRTCALNHIIFSYESTLYFAKEQQHLAALALSTYRAQPVRRGEGDKGNGGGLQGAGKEERELWKKLKEESTPVEGRPEVFLWR